MSGEIVKRDGAAIMERVIAVGDLAQLEPQERVIYYNAVCDSVGLNPLTRPFEYIELNGKLTLYARRDATDQIRNNKKVNVTIVSREIVEDVYVVTARATTADGRQDESIGAVPLVREDGQWKTGNNNKRYFERSGQFVPLSPDDRANAMMKAETKSKRRVTLSVCGLGLLDETELESIPADRKREFKEAAGGNGNANGRTVTDEQTGEEKAEDEPDLLNDMVFEGAWIETLKGRGWTAKEAEAALKESLAKINKPLQQVNLSGRRGLLVKADEGKYDVLRDAMRLKAKQQQQQPAEKKGEEPPPPATTEAEVHSWDAFLKLAREAAGDNIDDETFNTGIDKALAKVARVGKPETTSKVWRVKQLDAIRVGAFDYSTGTINKVAEALA